MSIKKTLREIKAEQHYQNIVTTARALFSKYGFDRVTMDDICAQAGISKSTLYTHFSSKQDLLMIYKGLERDAFLEEHYTYNENEPFRELVRQFFFANFAYNREDSRSFNRDTYVSYIKIYRQEPLFGHFYNDSLRQLIQRGIRENAFRQQLTADAHYHMIHDWIIGFFIGWSIYPDDAPGADEMYDHIMTCMIDALLK